MSPSNDWSSLLQEASKDPQLAGRLIENPRGVLQDPRWAIGPEEGQVLERFLAQINRYYETRAGGQGLATYKVAQVFESSQHAFSDMRIMNWGVFLVGIILVATSLVLGVTGQREMYVLLFGGMGIVGLVTFLLVRPIHQVRDALSNFLQAHITFETMNHQIGVWDPRYFTPKDIEQVKEMSQALGQIRESSVRVLQDVLEEKGAPAAK